MIITRELLPGDALPGERTLCRMFGVNRSSVREALKRLEQSRLISVSHGRSSIVRDYMDSGGFEIVRDLVMPKGQLDPVAVRSIFELTPLLHAEAGRLAANRRTDEDLLMLRKVHARMVSMKEFDLRAMQQLDFAFVHAVTLASKNVALTLINNSVKDLYFVHAELFAVPLYACWENNKRYAEIITAVEVQDPTHAKHLCSEIMLYKQHKLASAGVFDAITAGAAEAAAREVDRERS